MSKNSIQFFGLPGSGKTSMLRELLQTFPEYYVAPPTLLRGKRFSLAFLFTCRFPHIAFRFLLLIVQNPKKLWGYIAHLVSVSFATHMYVRMHRGAKLFLIDEGIAQRLLSVAPKKYTQQEVLRYSALIDVVHSPVVITSGGNFSRFELEPDRMVSHRNALGESYYKEWSETLSYNFALLGKEFEKRGNFCKGADIETLHKTIQSLR